MLGSLDRAPRLQFGARRRRTAANRGSFPRERASQQRGCHTVVHAYPPARVGHNRVPEPDRSGGQRVDPRRRYRLAPVRPFVPAAAGGQTRNGAPRFRFGRPQQECVARFSISAAPLSLLDESERLTRKTTRLPGLDCSTNRRASEVDCYAEYARDHRAEQNKPPDASGANFFRRCQIQVALLCDRT